MKELNIKVRIDNNNNIATVVQKNGFENPESPLTTFQIIGILENLIHLEQQKMDNRITTVSKKLDNNNGKER